MTGIPYAYRFSKTLDMWYREKENLVSPQTPLSIFFYDYTERQRDSLLEKQKFLPTSATRASLYRDGEWH